jgi:ATP-binding cassette subfamily B (MDR/TAP) protein 1
MADKSRSERIYDTAEGVEILDLSLPVDDKKADGQEKDDKKLGPMSSPSAVFRSFGRTKKVVTFRWLGIICAIISGSVYPIMAFYFSQSFERLGASTDSDSFLDDITELAMVFLLLGAVGFLFLVAQSTFLEIAASESTTDYKIQWFNALLRQDMAYFDIKDVSSQATVVSSSAAKYKKYVCLFFLLSSVLFGVLL